MLSAASWKVIYTPLYSITLATHTLTFIDSLYILLKLTQQKFVPVESMQLSGMLWTIWQLFLHAGKEKDFPGMSL